MDTESVSQNNVNWYITVNVYNKRISIPVGDGTQRIKWLAHVAIARFDEISQQGWKLLGVPTDVKLGDNSISLGGIMIHLTI